MLDIVVDIRQLFDSMKISRLSWSQHICNTSFRWRVS